MVSLKGDQGDRERDAIASRGSQFGTHCARPLDASQWVVLVQRTVAHLVMHFAPEPSSWQNVSGAQRIAAQPEIGSSACFVHVPLSVTPTRTPLPNDCTRYQRDAAEPAR